MSRSQFSWNKDDAEAIRLAELQSKSSQINQHPDFYRLGASEEKIMEKKKLFTGKMNLELKKRIMKCSVWSVALYAAEMWTTQKIRSL